MIRHILLTFYRTALSSKFQLVTIVFGLTMSMVVSLLIYIYVREESIYDRHHAGFENLYRINTTYNIDGKVDETAKAALNTGQALMDFYPEVESATQILNVSKQTIKIGTELYASEKVIYADSNFFTFFNYPFIAGNPADALTGPNKAVISKSVAEQYFGSEGRALGSIMNVNNTDIQITGIYDEGSNRTHIPHTVFISLATLPKQYRQERNREYMWITTYNYIRLQAGTSASEFQSKLKTFNEKVVVPYVAKNEMNGSLIHTIENITNIHLNDKLRFDLSGAINPRYLTIFSAVAILTLCIALINYINLTTAQVSKRLKEIGIKKSIGATKRLLALQFLSETIIIVAVSFVLAVILLYVALPELNALTEKTFTFFDIVTPSFLLPALAFIVVFGTLAGLYPAILLSTYQPLQALQSNNSMKLSVVQKITNPGFIRKVLVTVQFSISVFLIVGTIFIFKQFSFLKGQELGFSQERVMVIDIPNDTTVSKKIDAIKNSLSQIAAIKSISAASSIPGKGHGALTMNVSQSGGSEIKVINTYFTDEKFTEALGIELREGRYFSKEFSTDPKQAFVVNEAAAKFLGWDDPLHKKITSPLGQEGEVIGVLKDFNYKSLHTLIEPLIIMNTPTSQGYLIIRIASNDIHETINQITAEWEKFDNAHPYEYFFLDEDFQKQYLKEERLSKIFTYFSTLAIIISCLGLIGLAIFTNELKTREIAIRKTLGASRVQVVKLLSKDFLSLVLLANIVAWPAAYWMVNEWLSSFAYKTPVTIIPFLCGLALAFAIAFSTIFYFANKAARQDIVSALKYN
jgi:putative ABC transport system permease protein